jgi:hypothetical protein
MLLGKQSLFAERTKVKVTLRLAVYRQSVRLGVKPLQVLGVIAGGTYSNHWPLKV